MTWHLFTGEYPPSLGGVADHSRLIADGFVRGGHEVQVWCPGTAGSALEDGVRVRREAGTWSGADCRRVEDALAAEPPGRVLVQWVPHAYGRRSLNFAFCRLVRRIARRGRRVEIVVHEPFLAFHEGSWRQDGAAAIHRAMVTVLLGAASRIWVAIPAWERRIRPWLLGRAVPIAWLPVPSNVAPVHAPDDVSAIRARYLRSGTVLVGHFGTFGRATADPLRRVLHRVLAHDPGVSVLLIGRDGEGFGEELRTLAPAGAARVHATGALDARALSCHLQACDLVVQPYIDGASTRRGTLMAALAHGKAVVTTIGRLSEPLWAEERDRSVAAAVAGEDDALAAAVVRLSGDASARARLGTAARELYVRRFALEHTLARLLADREAA
jgi:glycosyltransferase involved in cell wall biosynthesis